VRRGTGVESLSPASAALTAFGRRLHSFLEASIRCSSLATLAGLAVHYSAGWLAGTPLLTDAIAEWIMARTPSSSAVWLLTHLGVWAKPFAVTGGLAGLGLACWLASLPRFAWPRWEATGALVVLAALGLGAASGKAFSYGDLKGQFAFWLPAIAVILFYPRGRASAGETVVPGRRRLLASAARSSLPIVMGAGVAGVALESFFRNEALAAKAAGTVPLFPFTPPADTFGEGLVRPPVTPVRSFYGMSKNTVDPAVDPSSWRLRITVNGREIRQYRYSELFSLPRENQFVSLRCVSNDLKSNLMGTALWTGVRLGRLVDRTSLPPEIVEVAVIGVDGHGDSYPLDYAFSRAVMLAVGMNGETLNRTHGFPVRLITPRYYGFKHVKWIGEIAFVSERYWGTWPKMGYTKDPVIHTVSFIDRIVPEGDLLRLGGIAMTGHNGIQRVEVRADRGPWAEAELEPPLSPHTWTRWKAVIQAAGARQVEARALDGRGEWQASEEGPLFPDGVKGPTVRRLT
jgi:DMSO/TMAO reductase YedYZ molybdopterin-dependent catalytic subunit